MTIVLRTSPVTGEVSAMQLDISLEQLARWKAGEHIQDVAPNLTPDEREFIISGCTREDWIYLFGEGE
jgi:hypothetical protein